MRSRHTIGRTTFKREEYDRAKLRKMKDTPERRQRSVEALAEVVLILNRLIPKK